MSILTKSPYSVPTSLRKCLQCGEMFLSKGPGNRICPKHKVPGSTRSTKGSLVVSSGASHRTSRYNVRDL